MTVISLQRLPLGFRFNPTDEELINHYLKRKINGRSKYETEVIAEIDVCKCEPWDLPAKSLIQSDDNQWYFFAPKDRKYPNGQRSNRATEAGYWKATGKDRTIRSKTSAAKNAAIGMKKTLVFHRGRAPKGARTCWIMHEYRTTEPEFESGDQGGYVLYRLFKKSEEISSGSKPEEIEAVGLSPTPTKSSPGDTQHEADVMEDVENSMNHESPKSDLQEEPKSSVEKQPAGIKKRLGETTEPFTTYLVNPDGTGPSLSSDDHEAKAGEKVDPLLDALTHFSDLDYEQLNNDAFPNISSPMLPYSDHPFFETNNQGSHIGLFAENNAAWGSLDDFLDPEMFRDLYPSGASIFHGDLINAIELDGGLWDSASCKDSASSSDIDTEPGLAQLKLLERAADMESPDLSYGMSSLSTRSLRMATCDGGPLSKHQLNTLYENVSLPPYDSTASDAYSVGSTAEFLQDLMSNSEESSNQKNGAANDEGAAIEIRTRRPQHPPNSDNALVQQGTTRRRIRLQNSINNVFDSSTTKNVPRKKDGTDEIEIKTGTWQTEQPKRLSEFLADDDTVSSANSESIVDEDYEDEEGEHVDDNFAEAKHTSGPAVNKLDDLQTHDGAPPSSDVYQDKKPELRMRAKSGTNDQNIQKGSSLSLGKPRNPSLCAYMFWLVLSVGLLFTCVGVCRQVMPHV